MPFFLLFFLINFIYANSITINSNFKDVNRICIYNKENTSLYIKLQINTYNKICLTLTDASGVIETKCKYKEVEINPNSLRKNVVYYILDLYSTNKNYKYILEITGASDFKAGECPTSTLAKVANTSPGDISSALALGGVLAGAILIFFIIYSIKGDDDAELGD